MAQRKDTRRDDILSMTLEQIAERGMAATRVQDVAKALGISTALVHYHFDSKEALMVAAFEHYANNDLASIERLTSRSGPIAARVGRFLRECGPTGATGSWRLWIDAWSVALREPRIRRTLRDLDAAWVSALAALISEGVDEGVFTCADPAGAARRLISSLDGLSVASVVYGRTTKTALRQSIAALAANELDIDAADLGR
ncbi:TetR/AcrR family transcriptional regulator [Mariniluteicoccus flavus]